MPIYTYRCENDHRAETFHSVKLIGAYRRLCDECGKTMTETVIHAPLLVTAQPECRYDSPIDGKHVTSWAQRREDLARSGCRPYDPEMKTDYLNRVKREDAELDRSIEAHVEEVVEKMPTAKRGQLASELTEQRMSVEYARKTLDA